MSNIFFDDLNNNPNLYLFNCVLHLDEKTPHLHLDYIPVAEGYSKGLSRRNSISKGSAVYGNTQSSQQKGKRRKPLEKQGKRVYKRTVFRKRNRN